MTHYVLPVSLTLGYPYVKSSAVSRALVAQTIVFSRLRYPQGRPAQNAMACPTAPSTYLALVVAMLFHTEHLTFNTKKHRQYINITPEVTAALEKSGIREGMILVSAMHITAGVWVNDAEDGLLADIDEWLEKLAPYREDYRHHRTGETNGDSHLKSLIVHHQVIVPVTDGRLDFGPWQQVYYAEFDGRRPKRVIIKVMGE